MAGSLKYGRCVPWVRIQTALMEVKNDILMSIDRVNGNVDHMQYP